MKKLSFLRLAISGILGFALFETQCLALEDKLDDLLDNPVKKPAKGVSELSADLLDEQSEGFSKKALSRTNLKESSKLRAIRAREPEPGLGKLIYKDDFESYADGASPRHWPKNGCIVTKIDSPGNKGKVLKFEPKSPWSHCYLDKAITAANFRLKFDFLCGEEGEVTWLARLNGPRGHSLWSNENYYQMGFYTVEGQNLSFGVRHLWVGGGYPFEEAPLPSSSIQQPSHRMAWHSAEVVMNDDRIIMKLNGVRCLDGHYPVLMARTRKEVGYGFGLMGRDAYSSTPERKWVYNDWFDNVEIYDLGTEVKERRWPRRLHVAPWGDDSNSGTDPAHPWKTLGKAFSELRQGDRLTLQEGVYEEDVEWIEPANCDLPLTNVKPSEYPTIISATPHEKVVVKGIWKLKKPGWLQIQELIFEGEKNGLFIESVGSNAKQQTKVGLHRLTFADQSLGLALKTIGFAKIFCGQSKFLDSAGGLSVDGSGTVTMFRNVFAGGVHKQSGEVKVQHIHCTRIGSFPERSGVSASNCLDLADWVAAERALRDPENGFFQLKADARGIDAGTGLASSIKIPKWSTMPVVGKPDLGAFEHYPNRTLKCEMIMEEVDILSGLVKAVPYDKRKEKLLNTIKGLRPGDTLRVGSGLWTESGLTLEGLRGEPYAPIRIVSDKPLEAILHGSVQFSECDHLHLEGFRIAGYKGSRPYQFSEGLSWSECGRTWITGCEITAFGHAGVGGNEQGVTLLRNWIHDNGVSGLNHGIYWAGQGPAWVIGNTFYGNSGWAFHNHQGAYDGWQGWKHNVHHNLFIGPSGAIVTTGSRGRYTNNTIIHASNAAFWFYNDGHRNNLIANNIIVESSNGIHTRDGNVFSHNLTHSSKETFVGDDPVKGDPQFVAPDENNFRLKPKSPAKNAGTPVGSSNQKHPTLGAYDGNEEWAPPKPLPKYIPKALKKERQELKQLELRTLIP